MGCFRAKQFLFSLVSDGGGEEGGGGYSLILAIRVCAAV